MSGTSVLRSALTTLARHSAVYAVAEQLGRLAGFLLLPLTTGHLTPEEFGIRELLAVSLTLLAQVAGLHLAAGLARFYFDSSLAHARAAVVRPAVLSVAFAAGVVVMPLLLAADWLAGLLPGLPSLGSDCVRIASGIFAFQCVREVTNKVFQTQQRSVLFASLSLSKLLVEIGLQVTALVVLDWGLIGLLLAVLVSEALFALVGCGIVLADSGLNFRWATLAPMLAYSLPLIPNGALQFGLHSADRYMLGALSDDRSLGLYALAYKLGYIPNYLLLGPFLLIWYPFVFSLPDRPTQRETIGKLAHLFLLAMSGLCLATALFAQDLVAAATGTSADAAAAEAVPWIAGGYWLWALYQFLQTGLYIEKQTAALPMITLGSFVANLYLNAVLVPVLGYSGAAIATMLTFLVLCATSHGVVQRVFPVRYRWGRIITPAVAAVVTFAVAEATPWPALSPAGRAVRAGLLLGWLAGGAIALAPGERGDLAAAVRQRLRSFRSNAP